MDRGSERQGAAFRTTCWTDVLSAAESDTAGHEAFSNLYREYWDPIYAYVRRRGHAPSQAEELTQDFFVTLFTRNRLAQVTRHGGRFRSFLLTSVQNFLANSWDRATALKRGGGRSLLAIHDPHVEKRVELEGPGVPPETVFDREWARLLVRRAMDLLEAEQVRLGRQALFSALRPKLQGERGGEPYSELAAQFAMSEGALKVAVHRLRARYGELLRGEIARTVASTEDLQEELRQLMNVLGNDSGG